MVVIDVNEELFLCLMRIVYILFISFVLQKNAWISQVRCLNFRADTLLDNYSCLFNGSIYTSLKFSYAWATFDRVPDRIVGAQAHKPAKRQVVVQLLQQQPL